MFSNQSTGPHLPRRVALWQFAAVLPPLLAALLCLAPRSAAAQFQTREYPPPTYYLAFEAYNDGEFVDALRAFRSASLDGVRSTEGRWVDSICYYTMMGECLYQTGQLGEALEQYTAALSLFSAHRNWMLRVDFPAGVEPAQVTRRPAIWAATARATVAGRFPDRVPILQGRFDNDRVITEGGVLALPEYMLINAHEIARCTALAIRRRAEIMGVACQHDPLTQQVYQALSLRPTRTNHWSEAWVSVQLGLAAAAAGKESQAVPELNKGLLVAGQLDHPLTATALLELGKLAFRQGQYGAAATSFVEASLSAAWFSQYDLVAEALRWGALTHIVTGQSGVYPALDPATAWAQRESRYLEVEMLVAAAENAAVLNETAAAAALVEQARRRMLRTDMFEGKTGARYSYVAALANYQAGNLSAGDGAFAALMNFQRRGSSRLFEIGLVDRLYTSGAVSERVAHELYAEVLREPAARDWSLDPVETLSVVLTPHTLPLEHWFEAAVKRKEYERALEIADQIRRHRFYTSLPMGGRLLSLRWVLAGPPESLGEQAALERQDLLARFPHYAELARQAAHINERLRTGPLLPDDEEARRDQAQQLTELAAVSTRQEVLLRELALRRVSAGFVFPPPLDFKKTQAALPAGSLVLSFLATDRYVYAFVFGRDSYQNWQVEAPATVRRDIAGLLRGMGHIEKNQQVEIASLRDESWKEVGERILEQLTNRAKPDVWRTLDELIIVPDGPLWYVPFEALPVRRGESTLPLISQVRVRCVPTVSLALPDARGISPIAETAVIAGQLFPRADEALARAAVDDLRRVLPRVTRLTDPLPAPSGLYATLCERVLVLSDLDERARGPYDWSPLPLDRGKPGSALSNWMSLPWGGPQQIVLPGFHTPAENALKRGGNGSEVFLTVCGLMSTGARTVLLSRWRTGGQTSYDLMREFVQELPHTTASEAWQRSVQLVMDSEMVVEREPRVKPASLESGLKANHPFFWGGYLLVDTGAAPSGEETVSEVVKEPGDGVR